MERKYWTDEQTKQLIYQYEENECLWNTSHKEYRNRSKKNRVISEMASSFECSNEEIQRKLHNLRNQVSQEIKKSQIKKSGSGSDDNYISNWKYFPSLQFLVSTLTPKKPQSNALEKQCETDAMPVIMEFITEAAVTEPVIIETEEHIKKEINKPKKKKYELDCDSLFKEAVEIMKKPKDEFECFGEYVTSELKSLKSEYNKRRLKSEIRKLISQIADEDDASYWV